MMSSDVSIDCTYDLNIVYIKYSMWFVCFVYHLGQVRYRLLLIPPVGPMRVPCHLLVVGILAILHRCVKMLTETKFSMLTATNFMRFRFLVLSL